MFYIVVLGIGINTQKPPYCNREAFKAIFSCPKVVQIENTISGKHVNTPNKWGNTYLFGNFACGYFWADLKFECYGSDTYQSPQL